MSNPNPFGSDDFFPLTHRLMADPGMEKIIALLAKTDKENAELKARTVGLVADLAAAAEAAKELESVVKDIIGDDANTAVIVKAATDHALAIVATADSAAARATTPESDLRNNVIEAFDNHPVVSVEAATDQDAVDVVPDSFVVMIEEITQQNKQLIAANDKLLEENEALKTKFETLARENRALKVATAGTAEEIEEDSVGATPEDAEENRAIVLSEGPQQDADAERRALIIEKTSGLKNECLTPTLMLFDLFQSAVRVEEGGKGWGKITVTIRTGFEETAAFFWDVERFDENIERFVERRGDDFEMDVRKTLQNSNILSQVKSKVGDMVVGKKFFSRMNMHRADERTVVILSRPIDEREEVAEATAVRICKVGEKKTVVDLITKVELGNDVSRRATRGSSKKLLATATDAAYYFDNLLGKEEASGEDGRRFGEQLMKRVGEIKIKGSKNKAVKDFIGINRAMRELEEQHGFVGTLLCAVVRNKLKRDAAKEGDVQTEEEAKGREIGGKLKAVALTTATAKHAVDEWAHQHQEVQEIMSEHEWFRPMLEEIAVTLFKTSKLGLKARVIFGAVTSMSDLLTDIYVTYTFGRDGKGGYFKASLASLIASIGFQILFVWAQNRKLGMKKVLREWIPILLGYKPAIDAYRVATGAKQEVGTALHPMTEMTGMKCIEMFAEAIPGVIIQLMAISTSVEEVATAAWISLAVSALSTGFASATISYDYDTDPWQRKHAPDFYGYIPANASKRSLVFVSMVLLTAGMLLIRCMTIVVLGQLGGSWVSIYIGADMGFYLLVKIVRGDFWYFLPLGGKTEIMSSFLARVMIKIITDYTSIVQFRHPNEVGGAYWLFGYVLTLGSLPVAIIAVQAHVGEEVIHIAQLVAAYFTPFSLLCFIVFFLNIEKKYWGSFWSTQRSKDMSLARFSEGKTDYEKFCVFWMSRHHWISIEDNLKKWVGENWAKWEQEEPDWFNDANKAYVPVEFIPTTGEARRRESVRRASVDAEAEGGLGGILRASIRKASIGGAIEGHVKVVPIEGDN